MCQSLDDIVEELSLYPQYRRPQDWNQTIWISDAKVRVKNENEKYKVRYHKVDILGSTQNFKKFGFQGDDEPGYSDQDEAFTAASLWTPENDAAFGAECQSKIINLCFDKLAGSYSLHKYGRKGVSEWRVQGDINRINFSVYGALWGKPGYAKQIHDAFEDAKKHFFSLVMKDEEAYQRAYRITMQALASTEPLQIVQADDGTVTIVPCEPQLPPAALFPSYIEPCVQPVDEQPSTKRRKVNASARSRRGASDLVPSSTSIQPGGRALSGAQGTTTVSMCFMQLIYAAKLA